MSRSRSAAECVLRHAKLDPASLTPGLSQSLFFAPQDALLEQAGDGAVHLMEVDQERHKRITTSKLNEWLKGVLARHNPPMYRNQRIKINYMTQVRSAPPVFQFFTNQPKGVREGYRRYLENRLRESFGFEGVPIKLVFKQK